MSRSPLSVPEPPADTLSPRPLSFPAAFFLHRWWASHQHIRALHMQTLIRSIFTASISVFRSSRPARMATKTCCCCSAAGVPS
jgi:hypothetical protein